MLPQALTHFRYDLDGSQMVSSVLCGALLALVIFQFLLVSGKQSIFPIINGRRPWEFSDRRILKDFTTHVQTIMQSGLKVSGHLPHHTC